MSLLWCTSLRHFRTRLVKRAIRAGVVWQGIGSFERLVKYAIRAGSVWQRYVTRSQMMHAIGAGIAWHVHGLFGHFFSQNYEGHSGKALSSKLLVRKPAVTASIENTQNHPGKTLSSELLERKPAATASMGNTPTTSW